MKNIIKGVAFLLLFFLVQNESAGQGDYPMPVEYFKLVNDFAGILNYDQQDIMEVKHGLFYDTTGIMVPIIIVDNIRGMSLRKYAEGIYNAWSLETLDENEATLILVYKERQGGTPKMYIHTQGKYRSIISPSVARLIASTDAEPWFERGNNMSAINSASNSVTLLLSGQISPSQFKRQRGGLLSGSPGLIIILVVAILALGARTFLNKKRELAKKENSSKSVEHTPDEK